MLIAHCPTHKGVNFEGAKALGALSTGLTEMDPGRESWLPKIRSVYRRRYRVITDEHRVKGLHSQEVPIIFRRRIGWRLAGSSVTRLAAEVSNGIGNDRYVTEALYHARFGRRKFAHLATHWMASLQDHQAGLVDVNSNHRAAAMVGASEYMEGRIRTLRSQGYEVVVTGDFNYRTHHVPAFRLWEYSPQKTFQRSGLQWHEEGIDYIAWSPGLRPHRPIRVLYPGAGPNRSDHPWMVADLVFWGK